MEATENKQGSNIYGIKTILESDKLGGRIQEGREKYFPAIKSEDDELPNNQFERMWINIKS